MGFVRSYGTPLEAAAQLGAEDVPGLATVDDSLWIDTCALPNLHSRHFQLNACRSFAQVAGGDVVEEAGVEILDRLQLACAGLGRGVVACQ